MGLSLIIILPAQGFDMGCYWPLVAFVYLTLFFLFFFFFWLKLAAHLHTEKQAPHCSNMGSLANLQMCLKQI